MVGNGRALIIVLFEHLDEFVLLCQPLLVVVLLSIDLILLELNLLLGVLDLGTELVVAARFGLQVFDFGLELLFLLLQFVDHLDPLLSLLATFLNFHLV